QLKDLDNDYRAQYGKSFRDAILNDKNLSNDTKEALKIYLKNDDIAQNGIDKRSAQDQLALADLALKAKSVDMLGEALRGDTPAAREARATFKSQKGEDALKKSFDGDDLVKARDYMNEGRISLATIADEDTRHWYHSNKDD